MTVAEQREAARLSANDKRRAVAATRQRLQSGTLTLADAMSNPPDELLRYPLIDVIRFTRRSLRPGGGSFVAIGRQAIRDDVNLMVPLGRASARSRAWVAEFGTHGQWGVSA